ncbi:MAG: hypothetical protein H6713_23480 [Myxococcales bacterium]|nr:hypothetical protein [Myxococcales bacterium]MCB9752928.1 hypothetical protein [Myxococcales bacterium]
MRTLIVVALCALSVVACNKGGDASRPPEASAENTASRLVKNVDAKPGDTTTCPFSGKPFVVKAEHPRVDYNGASFWVCSESAAEQVRADPAKYLEGFDG